MIKNFKNKQNKNQRLKDLYLDVNTSNYDKGWILQELNMIKRGWKNKNGNKKRNIRNPPGKDLAHEYGREALKGYGYEHTNFKFKKDHINQHKLDFGGRKNKERPFQKINIT